MVIRFRPSTGLLLLFSLLALINLSNSLFDEENLDILHKYFQGGIKQAAEKKTQLMANRMLAQYHLEQQIENLYPILRQLTAATKNTALEELKDVIITFIAKTKNEFVEGNKSIVKEIEDIWAVIELQEDSRDVQ